MIETLGTYRILKRLGSGGMGEVYLAEDQRLQRKVALKVLGAQQSEDQENQKRLRREAQAVARLDHPNICTVYEVGDWERGTYIAMQAVEGSNLADLMAKGRFTLNEVLNIGIQTADALIEAHGKGILHRDLKPHNLMLTPKGLVKVLDFGLAKPMTKQALGESIASGVGLTIGTVPYMSPEQVRGDALDGRSDLFSLGLVLYELATGQRAFGADSAVEVMAAILREEPPEMADRGQMLHPGLKAILSRLLEKDRDLRTPNAQTLKGELEHLRLVLSGGGDLHDLPTAKVPLPLRLRRMMRRVPRWALVSSVAGLVLGAGLTGWALRSPNHLDSIAILPIVTDQANADVEYVADGLTEQLINQLSHLPQLRVISRTSVLRYKGQPLDMKVLSKELGVDSILTGRLSQREGNLVLSVELADTRDHRHLWGDQIIAPLSDIGEMQDRIAHQIGKNLGHGRQPEEQRALAAGKMRVDPEAYRLYLKGRFYQDKWTPEDFQKAISFFDQALAKDPAFAQAPAAKAIAYWGVSSQFLKPLVAMTKAKEEAQLALSINPELADAHVALAASKCLLERNWPGAEASLKRALELDPNSVIGLEYYAYFLVGRGQDQEALALLQRARTLDPMSPIRETFEGMAYFWAPHPDLSKAVAHFKRSSELDPDFWWPRFFSGWCLDLQGKTKEANLELEKAKQSGSTYVDAYLAARMAKAGDKAGAQKVLKKLLETKPTPTGYASPHHIAMIYLGLGDKKKALEWLKEAKEGREEILHFLSIDPTWDPLREDPTFKQLFN